MIFFIFVNAISIPIIILLIIGIYRAWHTDDAKKGYDAMRGSIFSPFFFSLKSLATWTRFYKAHLIFGLIVMVFEYALLLWAIFKGII